MLIGGRWLGRIISMTSSYVFQKIFWPCHLNLSIALAAATPTKNFLLITRTPPPPQGRLTWEAGSGILRRICPGDWILSRTQAMWTHVVSGGSGRPPRDGFKIPRGVWSLTFRARDANQEFFETNARAVRDALAGLSGSTKLP